MWKETVHWTGATNIGRKALIYRFDHPISEGTGSTDCIVIALVQYILDDQTLVDLKPAGQPEHASLNQCQLIAANMPELMLWAPPAGGGDKVSL